MTNYSNIAEYIHEVGKHMNSGNDRFLAYLLEMVEAYCRSMADICYQREGKKMKSQKTRPGLAGR